jgi:competence protein ComEC
MVMPTLRRFNIHALDEVMVSHLDQDHSGGLASVLALMPVHRLRTSDPDSLLVTSTPVNPQLEPSACVAGQHWQWDGVRFEVLHPSPQWLAGVVKTKKPDRNAASCVLRVAAQNGGSLLLTGDITAVVEGGLHDYGASLASEVLVAAHHGSKTSTSSGFLAQVAPALTVIQAGYRNRYGHPHPEVLERLREVSALARTDLQGAIELRWRSGARTISDFWSAHRRYWHLERYSE